MSQNNIDSVGVPPADFDAIEFINEPRWRQMSLGLERIDRLMHELGDPQSRTACVHVAGTNGKGSTCAYLESILRASGYRTGLFTSPYIERFEERIRVNGEMIPINELTDIAWRVKNAAEAVEKELGEHPTEFELMFACAAVYFSEQACDIVIYECGLGGRLDATNCVKPALSVITPIGLDHVDILGDTLEKIAAEKAGIIKAQIPVLSSPQVPEALDVIEAACEQKDCSLYVLNELSIESSDIDPNTMTQAFKFEDKSYETHLLGSYQPVNACLALCAADLLHDLGFNKIDARTKQVGVANAEWPGRFEVRRFSSLPMVVIDGAHNADGARSLYSSLKRLLEESGRSWDDVIAVCGVLRDKDYQSIVDAFVTKVKGWVVYAPDNPRALSVEELSNVIAKRGGDAVCAPDAKDAIALAIEKAGPEGVVAAFGSLYSISSIKQGMVRAELETDR